MKLQTIPPNGLDKNELYGHFDRREKSFICFKISRRHAPRNDI